MASTNESHPRAYLSDYDVYLIRALRSQYDLPYGEIGEKFERPDGRPVPRETIRDICLYKTRP